MILSKKELYEIVPYDKIHFANTNNTRSKRGIIKLLYKNLVRKEKFKHLFLSFITFGFRNYKKRKLAALILQNELAKRKIRYVKRLHQEIENIRKTLSHTDPRDDINQIFMIIQSMKSEEGDHGVEFKKIYTPNELLLFITTPEGDPKIIRRPKALVNNDEYLRIWKEIRKNAKNKQFHQIDKINTCYSILKTEYKLAPEQISDRIHRTKTGKDTPEKLSCLKHLLKSFQEIVIAFQDLDELEENDPSLFSTLTFFLNLSPEEIQLIERFIGNKQLPKDLPLTTRKAIIQIANKTDVLEKIMKNSLAHMVELILNSAQWNLFLHTQTPSESTLKLLNWAYHETVSHTPHDLSFIDTFDHCHTTKAEESKYQELFNAAATDEVLKEMCCFFANEIHREWPSILFYSSGKEVYFIDKVENLSAEKLLEVFKVLKDLVQEDNSILTYLEGALSQEGKNLLQTSLQGKLNELLGEPSEYFIPVFNIAHIAIAKEHPNRYNITYYFRHKIFKRGENSLLSESSEDIPITLTLLKAGEHWEAHLSEKKLP